MKDAITSAMRSPAGRAAGFIAAAIVGTFLVGYVLFGPIAMHLLPR
jgi:flagellar motor component MotA